MSTLVVAEHLRGEIRDITPELVTAAQDAGGPVTVAVIAKEPGRFTDQVNLQGVDEIVNVAVEQEEFENDVYQSVVEALISERRPDVTLVGFTINGMGFGPAVAAKLGLGFASDVLSIRTDDGGLVAERSFYGAKVNGEVEFPGKSQVLLMTRPTSWAPAEAGGNATVSEFSPPAVESRARHQEYVEVAQADVDITTADFLLSIGRGVGDKENIPQFQEVAERMGAILSVSRPIVDSG